MKNFEIPDISFDMFTVVDVITVSIDTTNGGKPSCTPFAAGDEAITPKF